MAAKHLTPPTERQRRAGSDPRRDILAYLRAHPSAADTADGIADWWLPRPLIEAGNAAAIQLALDDLVSRGIVDEIASDIGTTLYRLHRPGHGDPTVPGPNQPVPPRN